MQEYPSLTTVCHAADGWRGSQACLVIFRCREDWLRNLSRDKCRSSVWLRRPNLPARGSCREAGLNGVWWGKIPNRDNCRWGRRSSFRRCQRQESPGPQAEDDNEPGSLRKDCCRNRRPRCRGWTQRKEHCPGSVRWKLEVGWRARERCRAMARSSWKVHCPARAGCRGKADCCCWERKSPAPLPSSALSTEEVPKTRGRTKSGMKVS